MQFFSPPNFLSLLYSVHGPHGGMSIDPKLRTPEWQLLKKKQNPLHTCIHAHSYTLPAHLLGSLDLYTEPQRSLLTSPGKTAVHMCACMHTQLQAHLERNYMYICTPVQLCISATEVHTHVWTNTSRSVSRTFCINTGTILCPRQEGCEQGPEAWCGPCMAAMHQQRRSGLCHLDTAT